MNRQTIWKSDGEKRMGGFRLPIKIIQRVLTNELNEYIMN